MLNGNISKRKCAFTGRDLSCLRVAEFILATKAVFLNSSLKQTPVNHMIMIQGIELEQRLTRRTESALIWHRSCIVFCLGCLETYDTFDTYDSCGGCCLCGFKAQQCLRQWYGLKTLSTTRKPPFLTKVGLRLQVQALDSNSRPPILRACALTTRLYTDISGEHIQAFVTLKWNVTKSSFAPVPFKYICLLKSSKNCVKVYLLLDHFHAQV